MESSIVTFIKLDFQFWCIIAPGIERFLIYLLAGYARTDFIENLYKIKVSKNIT